MKALLSEEQIKSISDLQDLAQIGQAWLDKEDAFHHYLDLHFTSNEETAAEAREKMVTLNLAFHCLVEAYRERKRCWRGND